MTVRADVYRAIDSERDYQDQKWGGASYDSQKSVGDFLLYIRRYVDMAQETYSTATDVTPTLENIRKIAALAVACMEYNGAPRRN